MYQPGPLNQTLAASETGWPRFDPYRVSLFERVLKGEWEPLATGRDGGKNGNSSVAWPGMAARLTERRRMENHFSGFDLRRQGNSVTYVDVARR